MAPDIVDISSDEDEFDGLSLPRANGRRQEESDDVVVVEEFSAPAVKRRKQNSGSFGPEKGGASDDDDDCLVLDSDPDKLVSVVDGKGSVGGDGGDDLLIVAEKGQGKRFSIRFSTSALCIMNQAARSLLPPA